MTQDQTDKLATLLEEMAQVVRGRDKQVDGPQLDARSGDTRKDPPPEDPARP